MRRFHFRPILSFAPLAIALGASVQAGSVQAEEPRAIDFTREIRPLLSDNCFHCHGPDEAERKGGLDGLRLDTREGATEDMGGYAALVPGAPDDSEFIRRIQSDDEYEQMPPADIGKKLTPAEVDLLTEWVRQGAHYAPHWAYVAPTRPAMPEVQNEAWPNNPIDHFIAHRLEREKLAPAEEADRAALIRRVSLDLTGVPPTWEEVEQFVHDPRPDAYEQLVDKLLQSPAYGEHWARKWLDLARYADSAGYADDPLRVIWAYRDYVIRSLNANKPFDQFTIEQIAGDLLPNPTDEQLIATAFHRNTLTNNEGGTDDEEFRNVAVVDRVNTTMDVWMGTTMACAQCHTHKYDPITQEDYFRFFAIFNSTQDADRRDESPLLEVWSDEQNQKKDRLQSQIAELNQTLATPTPELLTAQAEWAEQLAAEPEWTRLRPQSVQVESGAAATVGEDGAVSLPEPHETDSYVVDGLKINPSESRQVTALRIEALTDDALPNKGPGHGGGNFVVSRVEASIIPRDSAQPAGRYVRIELPGKQRILSLAEVQVFRGAENLALHGAATQSSTDYDGPAPRANDGRTNGDYAAGSVTHTRISDDPWWEIDLHAAQPLDRIVVWNRTDHGVHARLKDFRLLVLDENRRTVWEQSIVPSPQPSAEYALSSARRIELTRAAADFAQQGFAAEGVLDDKPATGWAIAPRVGEPHTLTLFPAAPVEVPAGATLRVVIEQRSPHANHTLGRFRLAATSDPRVAERSQTPAIASRAKR